MGKAKDRRREEGKKREEGREERNEERQGRKEGRERGRKREEETAREQGRQGREERGKRRRVALYAHPYTRSAVHQLSTGTHRPKADARYAHGASLPCCWSRAGTSSDTICAATVRPTLVPLSTGPPLSILTCVLFTVVHALSQS